MIKINQGYYKPAVVFYILPLGRGSEPECLVNVTTVLRPSACCIGQGGRAMHGLLHEEKGPLLDTLVD